VEVEHCLPVSLAVFVIGQRRLITDRRLFETRHLFVHGPGKTPSTYYRPTFNLLEILRY